MSIGGFPERELEGTHCLGGVLARRGGLADERGPRHGDEKVVTGKVGADLTVEQSYEAAKLCGLSLLVNMIAAIVTLERVDTVLKVCGTVNAAPDITQHPEVINRCTDLLVRVLGEGGRPARSAVGMSSLPEQHCSGSRGSRAGARRLTAPVRKPY
ncbi:MAG: RidA family protein [Acetobacteraceae bacterium]